MARQQERLVKAIRARRRAFGNRAQETVRQTVGSLDSVRDSVRRYPAAWAIGGTIAGIVTVRRFGSSLMRGSGKLAGRWAQKRFSDALLAAALQAVDSVRREANALGASRSTRAEEANRRRPPDRPSAAQHEESHVFMDSTLTD